MGQSWKRRDLSENSCSNYSRVDIAKWKWVRGDILKEVRVGVVVDPLNETERGNKNESNFVGFVLVVVSFGGNREEISCYLLRLVRLWEKPYLLRWKIKNLALLIFVYIQENVRVNFSCISVLEWGSEISTHKKCKYMQDVWITYRKDCL